MSEQTITESISYIFLKVRSLSI